METPSPYLKKSFNFGRAVIRHLADNCEKVTQDVYEKRLATCSECEFFDADDKVCTDCLCLIEIKGAWRSEDCPKGKWPKTEPHP